MMIRVEEKKDWGAVYDLNLSAFETSAEAGLVNVSREKAEPVISLVAEEEGKIVGHIMFSPVSLSDHPDLKLMGLAPMAVDPGHQYGGIGSALVEAGLKRCRQLGFAWVVVLGHPDYYSRFGFLPSSRFGIDSEYEVPAEVFMVMELRRGALNGRTGRINYDDAFREV